MRDDLISGLFPVHGADIDPVAMARRDLQKKWPKRFYKSAHVELRDGLHTLLLDGRAAKTPARSVLAVPNLEVAHALAAEWNAQEEVVNPLKMPLTRLINSALDGVANEKEAVRVEIVRFSGSDLVCYRAERPDALVREQGEAWDPVLAFAKATFDADFHVVAGVMHKAQPPQTLTKIEAELARFEDALKLAALNVMTTLSGSALIALAVAHRHFDVETAFNAAHVDEDYQARVWGADDEALERRALRKRDFEIAAFVLLS